MQIVIPLLYLNCCLLSRKLGPISEHWPPFFAAPGRALQNRQQVPQGHTQRHAALALAEVSSESPALSGRARLKSQQEAVSCRNDGVSQRLSSTRSGKAGSRGAYAVVCLQIKTTGLIVQNFRFTSMGPMVHGLCTHW